MPITEIIAYDADPAIAAMEQLNEETSAEIAALELLRSKAPDVFDTLAKSAGSSEKALALVQGKLAATGQSLGGLNTDKAASGFGAFSDKAVSAAAALGPAHKLIGLVNPALGEMADQLSNGATKLSGFGGLAAGLPAILGPIGIAVGAAAAAYAYFSQKLEEANEKIKASADALVTFQTQMDKLKIGVDSANLSLAAAQSEYSNTTGKITDETMALIQHNAEQQANATYADLRSSAVSKLTKATSDLNNAESNVARRDATVALRAANKEIGAVNDKVTNLTATLVETNVQLLDNTRHHAAMGKAAQQNAKDQDALVESLFAQLSVLNDTDRQLKEVADSYAYAAMGPGRTDSRVGHNAALDDMIAQAEKLGVTMQDAFAGDALGAQVADIKLLMADIALAPATSFTDALYAQLKAMLGKIQKEGADTLGWMSDTVVTGMADAFSSVLSGSVSGMLSAFGPEGALIGGLIDTLAGFGESGGAAALSTTLFGGTDANGDKVAGLFDNVVAGITALPEALAQVLPRLFSEGIPDLVGALIEASPAILGAMIKASALMYQSFFTNLPYKIGEALASWLDLLMDRLEQLWTDVSTLNFGNDANSGMQKAQNTAADATRALLALATFGASEVIYQVANGATGGKAQDALYAGTRESRSAGPTGRNLSAGLSHPKAQTTLYREQLDVTSALSKSDNRNNLMNDNGTRISPFNRRRN